MEALDDLQSKARHNRVVEKLGKQGFHYDVKEIIEPITDTTKKSSEEITKTITETSIKHKETIENLNDKN